MQAERTIQSAKQGSAAQQQAHQLNNSELAGRLETLTVRPRAFGREIRDALLGEAAKRLRWPDNYAKHEDQARDARDALLDAKGNEIKVGARAHRLGRWGEIVGVDADTVRLRFDDDGESPLAGHTGTYKPTEIELSSSAQAAHPEEQQ